MKYLIIGAGSIGSLLGVKLALAGNKVEFVVKKRNSKRLIENNGIILFEGDKKFLLKTKTYLWDNIHYLEADYVIVAVKSHHATTILPKLKEIIYTTSKIVTIQNGITPHIIASDLFEDRHIIISLKEAAYKFDVNKVRHAGSGVNTLTSFNAPRNVMEEFAEQLASAGIRTQIKNDAMEVLYRKLAINCIINPLTALFSIKNGKLVKFLNSYLVNSMISEILEVFEEEGVSISKDEIMDNLINIIKDTRENKSSMLQDIEWKRKTEIEFLTGYILERAAEYGVNTPSNRIIYELVKQLEVVRGTH